MPDFSAPTHARFRNKLDEVVVFAQTGDVQALKALAVNLVNTSLKAIALYRDLAVTALKART